ncbi:uDP-N-acetylglucosamine--N-acetylmuramyl-(pentapeptide) pyrophosphoryl-undecaprenol N-acetylglucosamine transferase 2 [Mycoplasma sp. CAG:776]|nr:uDP-N-acetylglucosamine--N-acetylmuramyl-(pentapeptide) pyrophosphoryl-undecaprenol N-acetylglucosamine transferase 2 [Mycoplasma sp. CAG:776]
MKVVVSAGGTGGHIYPALAILEKLKKEDKKLEVLYIGTTKRMESEIIPNRGIEYVGLDIYGFSKNIFRDIKNVFLINKSYNKCLKVLKEFKPDIVLGFGGYVTYPVLKAAKKLKIKTFLHEQNSIVGKTNKFLSKDIDLVAVSFLSTLNKFPKAKKVIYSGNPCGENALTTKEIKKSEVGLDNKKKLVIVVAGSLGSSSMNEKLKEFLRLSKKSDYQVLYITGKQHYEEFIKGTRFGSNIKVMPYLDNLAGLMRNCNLIITRAGASTMSEILALSLPAIFIPSPYVAGNHQYYNALEIVKNNAGLMIEEENLKGADLFNMVTELLNDKKKYEIMKMNLKNLGKTDSSDIIVREIKELIK